MLRKSLLFIFISTWAFTHVSAQTVNKEFDKLIFLFIDEKYEKCASMGLKYTEDEQLRKDPIPYVYVAMSLFEISKDASLNEKHPDAFKDAQKYAYKFRQKDKNDTYYDKYSEFLIALKDSSNRRGQYFLRQEEYRKAASMYKYTVRFAPEDPIMLLWQGISDVKAKNIGEGERNMNMAMEKITDSYVPDKEILWVTSAAFEEYAAYMDSKGDYAGKRRGQQLAEKYKKFSPEEIERQKQLEAEKNKPKREVKTFATDEETVEGQKPKIIGTTEKAEDAKKELEQIEQEQKQNQPKKQVKTFSSE
jgi:hypothetical protein